MRGYITLITVILVSAVVLAIATTVSLLAIGEAQSSFSLFSGEDALQFVEGCTEDALLKSRASAAYTGGVITRPEGTCSVTVSKAGNVWTVTVTSAATQYKRTIQTVFTRGETAVTLTSWKEL